MKIGKGLCRTLEMEAIIFIDDPDDSAVYIYGIKKKTAAATYRPTGFITPAYVSTAAVFWTLRCERYLPRCHIFPLWFSME